MQKLQDSVFNLVKTTNLSPAVFSFLQPTDDFGDKTPLGGILKDTKYGWLALGSKFCVVDLRTGMKVAARTFGATLGNSAIVTSVVELPTPLTEHSQQLIISLQCDDISIICILNINSSQILRCIQTDVVVTKLAVCDNMPDGVFTCFDGVVMAGTKRGQIFAFDLNRAALIQALKDISQGYEHLIQNELNPTNLSFLPLDCLHRIEEQRELALQNDHQLAVLLNESSFVDGQYIFRNPDGTTRMKAKRDHIRVTVLEYIPQTGSLAVGYNFGAFQIWNLMTPVLEFTSQVNVECLPVTHFGFQEPCDDPRAFCYLWVIFSVIDRLEEDQFPLAVLYSLTYQGKRMLSDTKCLYQEFSTAAIRFQIELTPISESSLLGGKCISCHTYSIKSPLGEEGEDSMLNLCQLVWECWAENANSMQYGMLLFDLDQWYKDQMPSTYQVESNAFLSALSWCEKSGGSGSVALHARLDPASVTPYSHATRLEEHFYPNSLQYNCICLNTSEVCVLSTIGIQRQIISSMEEVGPSVLLNPQPLYGACARCALTPLYANTYSSLTQEDQRRYLLSVALEARLARFLRRCARDWATGSHSGVGCTLPFLVDWCWKRAIELKENAKELTAPLFISSALPDSGNHIFRPKPAVEIDSWMNLALVLVPIIRNIVRCLEHCVQQLTQLTGLMDSILTKCCNLVVPDALSEMEEKHKGISTVSLYFQVVQWFLRVGLLPERADGYQALPYPANQLYETYNKRRVKLNRVQQDSSTEDSGPHKSCTLLYIDQLMEQEFGGDRIRQMWIKSGSECGGLYPPPSLYALLRLYLLPDIAEEHKHSLVLYLLVDYSMIYDDVRYEVVIRRLMQFPTMFGLSNTAIKATQAFWHLDHRDFDFALDQLQCLTGNTLSEWQHHVVLSSLLAQKKTRAALQYLHVRKPAPIHSTTDGDYSRVNDHDKLEDWQTCCNLYLARGLVYEALDVVRMCVQNATSLSDKAQVLNMFFKGCRNTGNLSKILSVTLLPFEEEVFIKFLENCNEPQTSDILIMYYLQHYRYLEAQRYNAKLRQKKQKCKDTLSTSVESVCEAAERESARDALVELLCAAVPDIASTVAHCADQYAGVHDQRNAHVHVTGPKPMSVYVQAKSPKNKLTYKSSFIQDTIDNASETWMNKPKMRKGLKRMLNIEETPFICTPKLSRSRSIFTDQPSESTPPKRARLNLSGTPKTPRSTFKVSDKLSCQMEKLLDMPEIQSPVRDYERPETPHSILKSRANSRQDVASPASRYLDDTDDELEMETASNHTHYSDTANKHLRFTIPTPTEAGTTPTPSPPQAEPIERERSASTDRERDVNISTDSYVTTASHAMNESNPLESPPKKVATEYNLNIKKSAIYKDTVRARRSLSISANSSLSEDPNTSIESIADIPITLINPKYYGSTRNQSELRQRSDNKDIPLIYTGDKNQNNESSDNMEYFGSEPETRERIDEAKDIAPRFSRQRQDDGSVDKIDEQGGNIKLDVPKTPRGRRSIRSGNGSTPSRSGSVTPERHDSPIITPLRSGRISRSRSKTPELSPRSSPLPPILELPKQEGESEPHAVTSSLSLHRTLRSRSRTPERLDRGVSESPKLEAITESPTKSSSTESPPASPVRRSLRARSKTPERLDKGVIDSPKLEMIMESPTKSSGVDSSSLSSSPGKLSLRSRSRTPEVEVIPEPVLITSPRSLRSRSKTPEKLMSPRKESARTKKSLSRLVLEANTFAKTKATLEKLEAETASESNQSESDQIEGDIACTPVKAPKQVPSLMDVTLSPIVNKSILHSSNDSVLSDFVDRGSKNSTKLESPAFAPLQTTYFEKSVLRSYQSSAGDSESFTEERVTKVSRTELTPLPAFTTIHEDFGKSVLHSYASSAAGSSQSIQYMDDSKERSKSKKTSGFDTTNTGFGSVLHSQESSLAEPCDSPVNVSSLITDDSDVQMVEENREVAKDKQKLADEKQERAEQKEKQQIVEIEREIHEIEDISSDDDQAASDDVADSGDSERSSDAETDTSSSDESESESEISCSEDFSGESESSFSNKDPDVIEIKSDGTSSDSDDSVPTKTETEKVLQYSEVSNKSRKIASGSGNSSSVEKKILTDINPFKTVYSKESTSAMVDKKTDLTQFKKLESVKTSTLLTSENTESNLSKKGSALPISIQSTDKNDSNQPFDIEISNNPPSDVRRKKYTNDTPEPMEVTINPVDQTQSSIMTDDNSVEKPDEMETSHEVEVSSAFELAQVSLMTEDSTVDEIEVSKSINDPLRQTLVENKVVGVIDDTNEFAKTIDVLKQTEIEKPVQVDDKITKPKEDIKTPVTVTKQTETKPAVEMIEEQGPKQKMGDQTEIPKKQDEVNKDSDVHAADPLAQVSLMTKGNTEPVDLETSVNFSNDKMEIAAQAKDVNKEKETVIRTEDFVKDIPKPDSMAIGEPDKPKSVDVVDTSASGTKREPAVVSIVVEDRQKFKEDTNVEKMATETKTAQKTEKRYINLEEMDTESQSQKSELVTPKTVLSRKRTKSTSSNTEIESKEDEPKTPARRKRTTSKSSAKTEVESHKDVKDKSEIEIPKEVEIKTPSRKRTSSKSSTKAIESEVEEKTKATKIEDAVPKADEPKTPVTRKRITKTTTKGIETSKEFEDTKTEVPTTPVTRKPSLSTEETTPENVTPRRTNTPTSAEVSKMMTRRMSRELKEMDEPNLSVDDTVAVTATPKRRNLRKNTDDNESVASGSSLASSIVSGESKIRKGRKSVLPTKPDLSVIPEVLAEDTKEQATLDVINEYSGARRMTRHQKSVMESLIEPTSARGRRRSYASRTSKSSLSEQEEEERPAFDLQPIDRISLLNKEAYEGPPDADELRHVQMSPESIHPSSHATQMRSRIARAASESQPLAHVKAAKIHRRIASVDVPVDSPVGSPAHSGTDSPARNRRASFNRAVEALHTPKGRRTSTDSRKSEVGSPGSPAGDAPPTPSRRQRTPSTHSNTSQTSRRSKKMPVLEAVKEKK